MEIIKINPQDPDKETIKHAINVLEDGGTVVYPTDTVYGLGANILSEKAIKNVYSIKKRTYDKPVSVCVSRIEDITEYACLDKKGEEIVNKILPGPFTIILNKKGSVCSLLTAGGDKIGIRIPDSIVCRELTKKFPITSTSANLSGKKVPHSIEEVIEQLDDLVDLILDAGKSSGTPSTVIDLTSDPPKILRKSSLSLNLNELIG